MRLLLQIPTLLWHRITRRRASQPWIAPRAIRYLNNALRKTDILLELGAGNSTAWYAQRVLQTVSLEPDPRWAVTVQRDLESHPNATLQVGQIGELLSPALNTLRPSILIVDHADIPGFTRMDSVRLALGLQESPRIIVIDDSDRSGYSAAFKMLSDWTCIQFTGFRDRPLRLTETSIFLKGDPSGVSVRPSGG